MKHRWWYDQEGDVRFDSAYACECGIMASRDELDEIMERDDCTRITNLSSDQEQVME